MGNRRQFIKQIGIGLGAVGLGSQHLFASSVKERCITILHTNDVHSHLESFSKTHHRYPGMGGAAKRASLIQKIRQTHKNVVLLDAGDMFQGTPYFNFFNGEPEIKLMNAMKYDAATIGNHDFDLGSNNLALQLQKANFDVVNANYEIKNTDLSAQIFDYTVLQRADISIGVFGLGIDLTPLVDPDHIDQLQYTDPIEIANRTARYLREEKRCHIVICLSHLGYKYDSAKISDIVLAKNSEEIDLIIGGHTHTFLNEPTIIQNKQSKNVRVAQSGWAGIELGKIDLILGEKKEILNAKGLSIPV